MAVPLIPILAGAIPTLIDAIAGLFPDNKARAEAEAKLALALLQYGATQEAQQTEVNKAEAAHASIFVAGWRPFIGWVCGLALAFQFLLRPFWIWASATWWPGAPVPPTLDGMLWELVFGMLGIGGLRTFEKIKKVSK